MKIRTLLATACLLLFSAAAFGAPDEAGSEAKAEALPRSSEAEALAAIRSLYARADYAQCRAAVQDALGRQAAGGLHLAFYQLAEIYGWQALVVYAFREAGYEKELAALLLKALEADINFDFADYSIVPPDVMQKYSVVRKKYMIRFAKSTKRHNVGLQAMLSSISSFLQSPQYFNLGLHYAFNLSDFLSLFFDVDVPFTDQFYNMMQFRVGAVWFASSRVEAFSLGLGIFYTLKPENWTTLINKFSFEGYGENIFRFGLGVGASVEVIRLDFLIGPGSFPAFENTSLFTSDTVRFSFASVRVYVFYTF